ncbi:MAG: ABC transporter permease, partial [Thermoanaerobaculia bacterium]
MNIHTNPVADSSFEPRGNPPALMSMPRPWYWSVRRELWENRSIYLAPLIVAMLVLFGSFIATLSAGAMRAHSDSSTTAKQKPAIVTPISMAPAPIMMTTILVGFFYCLDALYGERRDRSILFWKSLPVSDLTTVLSKASIPLVVLPLIGLVLSIATQLLLLPVTIAVSLGSGVSAGWFWAAVPEPLVMIYGLTVHALWFAPIYCWLLLVSAWGRRAPRLWAGLTMLAVAAHERITFNTGT